MTQGPPPRVEAKVDALQREVNGTNLRLDRMDERLVHLTESMDALTLQVGTFTEGLVKLENLITRGFENMEKQAERLEKQAERRDKQIDQQAAAIDRMLAVVQQQQQTVDRLLERN